MSQRNLLAGSLALLIAWSFNLPARAIAQRPAKDAHSFDQYLACTFDDELRITEKIRLPKEAEKFRMLATAGGTQRVSRIDGYTVLFVDRKNGFKVNLKVEQSDPQEYLRDKQIVIDNLKWVAPRTKKVDSQEIKVSRVKRFQSYGVDRATLLIGNVIGTYVFFSDIDQKIITIYFVNQGPRARKFTIDEYQTLRDKFLDRYATCAE